MTDVFTDRKHIALGPHGAGLGGELQGRVCAERRGVVHGHYSEGKEDGAEHGADPQRVPEQRAREGCAHHRERYRQEEEGSVPVQEQEVLQLLRFGRDLGGDLSHVLVSMRICHVLNFFFFFWFGI